VPAEMEQVSFPYSELSKDEDLRVELEEL